jgi:hypothetical protein
VQINIFKCGSAGEVKIDNCFFWCHVVSMAGKSNGKRGAGNDGGKKKKKQW